MAAAATLASAATFSGPPSPELLVFARPLRAASNLRYRATLGERHQGFGGAGVVESRQRTPAVPAAGQEHVEDGQPAGADDQAVHHVKQGWHRVSIGVGALLGEVRRAR